MPYAVGLAIFVFFFYHFQRRNINCVRHKADNTRDDEVP